VPDLAKHRFHVWITKYHYLPITALGVVLVAIGGLPFLFDAVTLTHMSAPQGEGEGWPSNKARNPMQSENILERSGKNHSRSSSALLSRRN
jgi:hypothetical protein